MRRSIELRARYRLHWWIAITTSFVVHLLVFVILGGRGAPRSPFAAAGPPVGDDRGAPSGGGIEVLDLSIAVPRPLPVVVEPIPVPEVLVEPEPIPEVDPLELEVPPLEGVTSPGTGGEAEGSGTASGVEGGVGEGDGGLEEEGRSQVVPPTPRGLILPPGDRPGRVRGREVEVWVFVLESGRVVSDSTRILPSTGDSRFDERLRRQAAQWVFRPAQRGGKVVAEWFRYTIRL